MQKRLNGEYGLIFATHWMFYGVVSSFCSAFLLDKGYSNSEIGVILAVASALSVVAQPLLADWADRSKKINVINVSQLLVIVNLGLTVLLFVFTHKSVALWIVYMMIMAWVQALQPLFNAFSAKLEETGYHINFGICRACGSLGYSVLIAVLGNLVENRGLMVLPKTGTIVLVVLITLLIAVDKDYKRTMKKKAIDGANVMTAGMPEAIMDEAAGAITDEDFAEHLPTEPKEEINLIQFMRRNKLFVVLNIGVIFLFFQNSILNSYMYQVVEGVGGNAADMGGVCSVMAFTEIPGLFFFEKLKDKFGCQKLLKIAAVAFTLKVIMLYLANTVAMVYAAHFFHLFCFGIFLPAMVIFIDEIMAKGEAVKGQSLYIACVTISGIFSSVFGGILLDISGPKLMLLVSAITAVIGTAFIFMLVDHIGKNNSTLTAN